MVPEGKFTQKLITLNVGDTIYINNENYGLMVENRFTEGGDLWLISTGTGIAPFISILLDIDIWDKYNNIIIVHGVRHSNEFAYDDLINGLYDDEIYKELVVDKLHYIKLVSKDISGADLYGRVTNLIVNGQLEDYVNLALDVNKSRVMLCGNPEMVKEARGILVDRGLTISRKNTPGNIIMEHYW